MIIYDDFTTIYLCIIIINFDMWFILFITSLILTFTGTMSHVHIISWLTTLLFLIIIHYSMGLPLLIIIFFIRIFNYSLTRGSCGRNALKYKFLISLHFLKLLLRIFIILLDCWLVWIAGILWRWVDWFWASLII
jgi:hypothetical protein